MKDPSSRLLRLYLKLSEYSITLEHKPGKHNIIADGLSRLPTNVYAITRAQSKKLQFQKTNKDTPHQESNVWEDATIKRHPSERIEYAELDHTELYQDEQTDFMEYGKT